MPTPLAEMFQHNLWANLRLLDVCASLTDDQLSLTLPGTYGTIRDTLLHIARGEEAYVFRLIGQRPEPSLRDITEFPGFALLRERLQASGDQLIAIAGQFDPGQNIPIPFDEVIHSVPATVLLIQAINHATDHRSQIATMLTQQGVTPPDMDGWTYFIEVIQPTQAQAEE